MKTQKKTKTRRGWVEGKVNTMRAHFEITLGSVDKDDPDTFPLVALVGRGRGSRFTVEFVLLDPTTPKSREMLNQVKREIEYYLIELKHPAKSRWDYAVYHSSTASNLYSKVHWAYFPKGSNSSVSPGNRS